VLVGRDREQSRIERLLDAAREGLSAALAIRGDAGMGKTALLERASGRSGMRTLRCTGVPSERDLPLAGLVQLLAPVRDLIDRLPEPQAAALRSAFGMSGAPVEDRLRLGLATLGILGAAAEHAPLLCLVDDFEWVDVASAEALTFAARRLGAEGVVMLFAGGDDLAAHALEQMTLAPLDDAQARELLATRRLSRSEANRLLREAAGNPLALLELPAQGDAGGGAEAAFRARVASLPAGARRLLLLAATGGAEEPGTWSELARLAGVDVEARRAIAASGLIADDDLIAFRHPLARSAAHGAASPAERAGAHGILAARARDPLARAAHLAAAATQPDEAVARELADAAAEAARRGGFASAATLFTRAAELSTDAALRTRRLIDAAQAQLDAGDAETCAALAGEALAGSVSARDRAALTAVRASLEVQTGSPARAYELLAAAARAVTREEPARALDLEAQAIVAAFAAGWPDRALAEARDFLRGLASPGAPYARLLEAFLEAAAGDAAREGFLGSIQASGEHADLRLLTLIAFAAAHLGDLQAARELALRAVAVARAAGSFNALPVALLAPARIDLAGRAFDDAEEWTREGLDLTRQLGQENLEICFSGIAARCLAARGRAAECRALGETTLDRALARGNAVAADDVRIAVAELELPLGRGAQARDAIAAVVHPVLRLGVTAQLAEAAIVCGDREGACAALAALAAYAEKTRDPQSLGLLARTRALLAASPELAEPLFLEALRRQTEHAQPFERARTALAYGEVLRRARRRTDARVQLRHALAAFEALDTPLWADRARAELEATGAVAQRRDGSALETLTPQQLRIAKLVAGGASNRQVASQLFLSEKTIEYHLRNVFLKLGVSSRVELANRIVSDSAAAARR
jgi:DNA-binding NarL/FixJ family response regulator